MSIETIVRTLFPPQSRRRAVARLAGWVLMSGYFLFLGIVFALNYWVLPKVGASAGEIEQSVSRALGQRVTIGAIDAGWRGLRPDLVLRDVTIHDRNGRAALTIPIIDATLAWTSLVFRELRFYSLVLERPRLEIRRDENGKFYVAGIEMHPESQEDTGIADWLTSQREIVIRDASLIWADDLRGTPLFALSEVNFALRNGFDAHRFALRAKAPAELASALDVRGELRGELHDPKQWTGRLYAQLEYTDLIAWKKWFDYPLDIRSGTGGVRVWLDFAGSKVTEVTADVALAKVATRLATDLPLLELDYLQGRLGAKESAGGTMEVSGRKLALKTGAGITLQGADFAVRWDSGDKDRPQRGEIEADGIELAPLANLAEYLPLPKRARARLAATEPGGSLHEFKHAWTGDAENPGSYSLRGSFTGLRARAYDRIPGFAGLSGGIECSEQGGTLVLGSEKVAIELPGIVADGRAQFDSLTAQIGWKLAPDHLELTIGNLSFANREIAGTLSGSFATKEGSPGAIDLTGRFSRADGPAVYRYIPWLPGPAVEYLKASIHAGHSNDVRLRLKGDLAKFPFEDPASGTFQVAAKLTDVTYRYAEGWPQTTGVTGDLIFEGKSMRVAATKAGVLNVKSGNVRASIPDLYGGDEQLHLQIQAEDQTADFLGFIAQSPVTKFLDRFTEAMQSTGAGRLALTLDLPLRRPDQVKIAGAYDFVNDEIRMYGQAFPFSQVNGRLEFSETGATARAITAQFLGGPASLSIATRGDGTMIVSAHGTVNVERLPRAWGESLLRRFSGATPWRTTITSARRQGATLVIESQLTGVSANLPAPFGKAAAEPLPLRIERVIDVEPAGRTRGDSIKIALGRSISAQIQRRLEGEQYVVERGAIAFNEPAVLPGKEGIAVTGSLPYLDVDRWRALLAGDGDTGGAAFSLNLKVAALDIGGKRLNDVGVRAASRGGGWTASVAAKELDGEITWQREGRGRIIARLKHFTVPESAPGALDADRTSGELPSIDIIAESLILDGKELGKLEVVAVNQARDWRIEKLVLANPESTLTVDGVWENWAVQPSVSVNVRLDISDIGKYLDRIGYPKSMKRGTAKFEGKIGWKGNLESVDYPTLTGNLKLSANEGQFLKVEPGAAKLLGVLSLQSWVTFDFRDMFGEGFAFDSISSNAAIAKGMLSTRNFQMRGPVAQVSMSGDVDLVRETQNLHARVVPSLGGSLSSIAAFLVNPVFGLGTLVVQRILKDPFGQIFAVEYTVTGSWSDPKVERLKVVAPVADPAAQSQ